MGINLNEIIPLGRSFQEYVNMFGLTDTDLDKKILDCGGGPSGFNNKMNMRRKKVTSIDPLYEFDKKDIEKRIAETFDDLIAQTRKNQDIFVWENIKTPDELATVRMAAMKDFLNDYETGKKENRYIKAELPHLPFADNEFDIALSSHFLFLYTKILSLDFHIASINEMLRVAGEVRVFPLLDLNAAKSPYVEQITENFAGKGMRVSIETVNYEFQKGGNQLLKIVR